MKKCTCNHPLAIHNQAVKFVAFAVLFMASSRLLEFGLKSLAQLLLSRVSDEHHKAFKDPLHVPVGPITKARSKKIKEALNGLI